MTAMARSFAEQLDASPAIERSAPGTKEQPAILADEEREHHFQVGRLKPIALPVEISGKLAWAP
jgi:hypothetical protein